MTFEFREDREAHLRMLCAEMGRSVDDFINEAVLTFMEDYEDGRDAKEAWAEHLASGEPMISLEEVMRKYGLDDRDLAEGGGATEQAGQARESSSAQLPDTPSRHAA